MEKIIANANKNNLKELSQDELASVGGGHLNPPIGTTSQKTVVILEKVREISQPDDLFFL